MKHLTEEELRLIETSVMPTASLERVRDLFVFQTYTCLSYTDLMAFDAEAVGAEDKVYTSTRGKTKQEFTFYLCAKARNILRKYGGRLPAISNEKYNEYLKVVAQTAKVDKPITSHWARHTGATMLLNKGVDMEVIAKILGHASTRQTRNTYARMLDSTCRRCHEGVREEAGLTTFARTRAPSLPFIIYLLFIYIFILLLYYK